jgi:hypothetical protein
MIDEDKYYIRGSVSKLTDLPMIEKISILRLMLGSFDKLRDKSITEVTKQHIKNKLIRTGNIDRYIFSDRVIKVLIKLINNLQVVGIFETTIEDTNIIYNAAVVYCIIKEDNELLELIYKNNITNNIYELFEFDKIIKEKPEILY